MLPEWRLAEVGSAAIDVARRTSTVFVLPVERASAIRRQTRSSWIPYGSRRRRRFPHGAPDFPTARPIVCYQPIVDSLSGSARLVSRSPEDSALADSLGGQVTVSGVAYGRLDSLDVAGAVVGNGLLVGKNRGRIIGGRFAIRNVLSDPTGTASVRFDTLTIDGVLLDSLGADLRLAGRSQAAFTIGVRSDNGPTARVVGSALATGGALGTREHRRAFRWTRWA